MEERTRGWPGHVGPRLVPNVWLATLVRQAAAGQRAGGREGGREESAKAKSRSRPRYSTPAPRPQRKAAETGAVAVRFPQNREPSLVPGLLQSRFALWLRYFWWAARPRAGRRGGGPGPDPDVDVDATRFDSSPARRPPRHSFSFLLRGLRLFFFSLVFLTPATSSPCKRLVLMRSRLSQAHPHFKRLYCTVLGTEESIVPE